MNIGTKIKESRIKKNLSQKELADITGISQTYISKIEENKRQPTLSKVIKLANALDMSIESLIRGIE